MRGQKGRRRAKEEGDKPFFFLPCMHGCLPTLPYFRGTEERASRHISQERYSEKQQEERGEK